MLAAVAEVVPPTSVAKAFVSHQDPDIASSLPLWNACNDHIQWHVPSLWEGFLRHYGALNAEFIDVYKRQSLYASLEIARSGYLNIHHYSLNCLPRLE